MKAAEKTLLALRKGWNECGLAGWTPEFDGRNFHPWPKTSRGLPDRDSMSPVPFRLSDGDPVMLIVTNAPTPQRVYRVRVA